MSCDDMYVCELGRVLFSCRIKIQGSKCDKFSTVEKYDDFMQRQKKA